MLERNNPAIDYDRLLRDVDVRVATPIEENMLDVEKELVRNEKLEAVISVLQYDIASAAKAHKVTSPLPALFNPIFRDQAAVNKAILKALRGLAALLESQREINTELLLELKALKQSDPTRPHQQ